MERSEIRGETPPRIARCALHPGYERTRFNPIHLSNSRSEQCSATRFNWVPGHPSVLSFRFPKGDYGPSLEVYAGPHKWRLALRFLAFTSIFVSARPHPFSHIAGTFGRTPEVTNGSPRPIFPARTSIFKAQAR